MGIKQADLLWISLSFVPGIGTLTAQMLLQKAGSIEGIWNLSSEAAGGHRIRQKAAAGLRMGPDLEKARKLVAHAQDKGMQIITRSCPLYPEALQQIADPPLFLYAAGRPELLATGMMAVVGARRCTSYGGRTAFRLGSELSAMGYTVVSGMASGIDAQAHKGALQAGGATIAVLGCGADVCYPVENTGLYDQIRRQGLILSEYAPGTWPQAGLFPPRNRIISGMSRGVVVVEAGEKSGSLITAKLALEQNRDVYAVPGSMLSYSSRGAHRLIQNSGAMILCDISDIPPLKAAPSVREAHWEPAFTDARERMVYERIQDEGTTMEDLLELGLDAVSLQQTLSMLELDGRIEQAADQKWVRTGA